MKNLFLRIDNNTDKMNEILIWAKGNKFSNIVLSGQAVFNTIKKVSDYNFNIFIQSELNKLINHFDQLKQVNRFIGFLLDIANKKSLKYNLKNIDFINNIRKAKKIIGVNLYYHKNYTADYIESYLKAFKDHPVSELLLYGDPNYLEIEDKSVYIGLFLKYKDVLEKTGFQCGFIDEFRPKKCSFLSIDNDIVVCNENKFSHCRYINFNGKGFTLHNGNDIDGIISRIAGIKQQVLNIRLKDYIDKGKEFYCSDCIKEIRKVAGVI